MSPEELKGARSVLQCTARELAVELGVDQATVLSWERGEFFPTKRHVTMIQGLLARGPLTKPKRARVVEGPWSPLADPEIWCLLRKLAAHDELRKAVAKLAEKYSDPAESPPA